MTHQAHITQPVHITPGDNACPGDCNREFWRAEQAGPGHDVPFTPGQPVWCPACRDRITADLDGLHPLAVALTPGALNTPRNVDTNESKALKRTNHPSLSPAWDTLDALIRWAVHLEDTTRARLGHTPNTTTRRLLWPALRYLSGNATAVLSDPDTAETTGRQIMGHHRSLTRVTGTDRPSARIPGECPHCARRGVLRRRDGDDLIRCGSCGATWDWDYYHHLTRVLIDGRTGGRRAG